MGCSSGKTSTPGSGSVYTRNAETKTLLGSADGKPGFDEQAAALRTFKVGEVGEPDSEPFPVEVTPAEQESEGPTELEKVLEAQRLRDALMQESTDQTHEHENVAESHLATELPPVPKPPAVTGLHRELELQRQRLERETDRAPNENTQVPFPQDSDVPFQKCELGSSPFGRRSSPESSDRQEGIPAFQQARRQHESCCC